MTIAEKLQIIANNEEKVYQAGYEKGLSDVSIEGKKFTTGTVTFATANSVQTVTHNLGVVPSFIAMYVKDLSIIPPTRTEEAKGNIYKFTHSYITSGEIDYGSCYQGNTTTGALSWTWASNENLLPFVDETTFKTGTSAVGYKFMANIEYEWIAIE